MVRTLLKAEPEPHQEELMNAIAQGHRRVSMRSGRRVGKTTGMVWLSLWFEMTHADAKTIVTAPSSAQLQDAYVPEFRKWVQRLPPELSQMWILKQDRFEFRMTERQGYENFVTIRTARKDQPESLQGINAPWTLVLPDEAAGVEDPVMESLSGSMGGDGSFMALTGNPNRNTGFFHATHTTRRDQWYTIHVNSEDVERVSREWIQEMRDKYGVHSNEYRIHVLGEFPLADDDTVIPRRLIEAAIERDVALMASEPIIWGLDVARFGDDATSLCMRQGNWVHGRLEWRNLDTMQVAGRVQNEYELRDMTQRPEMILVDVVGIGAGVVDRLRALGLPVKGINVSESPAQSEHYRMLKDELWDKTRIWFERLDSRIPNDRELIEQLVQAKKDFTPNGKMLVKSKKWMRERGFKSPDAADSLVLTFARSAAIGLYGRSRRKGALKRGIKGLRLSR